MAESDRETVFVRDREQVRQLADVDSWDSMTLIAVTSSDPRTFDELCRAWWRYRPRERLAERAWFEWNGSSPQGPWVLLDLAALRVVAGGGSELPEDGAAFQRDDGPWTPENPLVWINRPPGWTLLEGTSWCEALPPLPVPVEPLDVRGVLYGRPLAEFIARRAVELARSGKLPAAPFDATPEPWPDTRTDSRREADQHWHRLTVQAHADWLLTPREDLEGQPPRHFLHAGRAWLEREVDNRQRQWSQTKSAPRAIDPDTFAYRHGPLGRHEVVVYFDLCREVIQAAWLQLARDPETDIESLTTALRSHGQQWLNEDSIDGNPTPPAVIIETERRHLPLLADGSHLDCECPICQSLADRRFGPGFVGFDGHHLELEDEFAFSLCESREEWQEEREMMGLDEG
ncbi:MAG: hypothetical protein J5I93_19130 [Pirellulaceae bacterium]|nr:hypothetical protein [Pirellulaceae bacterium]